MDQNEREITQSMETTNDPSVYGKTSETDPPELRATWPLIDDDWITFHSYLVKLPKDDRNCIAPSLV